MKEGFRIEQPKVFGFLIHEATNTKIAVYKPIGWFKLFMIKLCFGLKYENSNIIKERIWQHLINNYRKTFYLFMEN